MDVEGHEANESNGGLKLPAFLFYFIFRSHQVRNGVDEVYLSNKGLLPTRTYLVGVS
jgi:hypothetical protein